VVGDISEFDSERKGRVCLFEREWSSCGVYRGGVNQRPGLNNDNDLTMGSRVLEDRNWILRCIWEAKFACTLKSHPSANRISATERKTLLVI
jgi:hypothetical protein